MKSSEAMILAVMNAIFAIALRSLKISGLQRGLNRDLAIPVRRSNQLSYEATDVGGWSFVGSYMIHSSQFIYDPFHTPFIIDSFLAGTLEPTNDQPQSGFIAQLVRASHRYREVTGSNPVEVLNFSGFSTQLQKLRS